MKVYLREARLTMAVPDSNYPITINLPVLIDGQPGIGHDVYYFTGETTEEGARIYSNNIPTI